VPPPRPHPIVLAALAAACAFVALLMLPGAVAHASWRWPLRGPVVAAFRVTPHAPYARGQRRGIDVAAAPGSTVRAACAGRVTFAGALPRLGLAISVRCGPFMATYLRLVRLAVRRGALVVPGQPLGELGRSGRLRLGARRATDRRGYVDPLTLLRDPGPAPPDLGPAPRARALRPRPPHTRPLPARPPPLRPRFAVPRVAAPRLAAPRLAPPRLAAVPRLAVPRLAPPRLAVPRLARPPARAEPGRMPWPAYPALALIAAALPVGGLVHRRRGRRRSHAAAARVESA
jgi:hypothetical protein